MKHFIIPSRLQALRKQKGLGVTALARKLETLKKPVSAKTISNIEKDENEKRPIRINVLRNLAHGLQVDPDVLSGEKDLPEKYSPDDKVEVELDAVTRLNYDLLERRYGVSLNDIVNVAPLLFLKAAKESLARQKKNLEAEVNEEIKKRGWDIPNRSRPFALEDIPQELLVQFSDEDPYFPERRAAIDNNDLFDNTVIVEEEWEVDPNPFAQYLSEICTRELGCDEAQLDDERFGEFIYFHGKKNIPQHTVCRQDIREITLGSAGAYAALVTGAVRIKDISEEDWEPKQAGRRVARLEAAYAELKNQSKLDNDDEVEIRLARDSSDEENEPTDAPAS